MAFPKPTRFPGEQAIFQIRKTRYARGSPASEKSCQNARHADLRSGKGKDRREKALVLGGFRVIPLRSVAKGRIDRPRTGNPYGRFGRVIGVRPCFQAAFAGLVRFGLPESLLCGG